MSSRHTAARASGRIAASSARLRGRRWPVSKATTMPPQRRQPCKAAVELAGAARQVADEAEAFPFVARGDQRREHGRRPRQHGDLQAVGHGARDEAHPRVLHAGRAGVGHQRDVLAVAQQAQDLLGLLRLVVLEEARQRHVDVEVAEQLARAPRVLRRHQLDAAQRVQDPRRDVAEVADGRGAHVQHGGPPYRNASMNTTSMSRPRSRACPRAVPTTLKPRLRW